MSRAARPFRETNSAFAAAGIEAAPAVDSDPAVEPTPEPAEGSRSLLRFAVHAELGFGKQQVVPIQKDRTSGRPRRTPEEHQAQRWPGPATCGKLRPEARHLIYTDERDNVAPGLTSRAPGWLLSLAGPGPSARACVDRLDESRGQPGKERREIRSAGRDRRRRCWSLMVDPGRPRL